MAMSAGRIIKLAGSLKSVTIFHYWLQILSVFECGQIIFRQLPKEELYNNKNQHRHRPSGSKYLEPPPAFVSIHMHIHINTSSHCRHS